jgi:hypothetical protein
MSDGGPLPAESGEPVPDEAGVEDPAPADPPADPHRGIVLWRLPSGERLRTLADETTSIIAFSPDGKRLAVADHSEQGPRIVLVDVATGTRSAPLDLGDPRAFVFVGEDVLAVQSADDEVRLFGLDGTRRLTIPTERMDWAGLLAGDARGGRLAVLARVVRDGITESHLAVYRLEDGEEVWRTETDWSRDLRFSPDGREVASGQSPLERRDAATGALLGAHRVRPGTSSRGAFAFHPSGRFVVTLAEEEPEETAGEPTGPDRAPLRADSPRPPRRWFAHVYSRDR